MKKEYIAPSMEVININAASAMLLTTSGEFVDRDQQLGREDNNYDAGHPSNPNLWEQAW